MKKPVDCSPLLRRLPATIERGGFATLGISHVLAGHATKPTFFAATRGLFIGAKDGFLHRLSKPPAK